MASQGSGTPITWAIAIIAGAFVVSAAATAGATVIISPSSDTVATGSDAAPSEEPQPTPSSSPSILPPRPTPTPQVTQAPEPPTQREVAEAEARLCESEPDEPPRMSVLSASAEWTQVLERLLWSQDLDPGTIDTRYTTDTLSAVEQLQQVLGLPANGTMDTATWEALRDDVCEPEEPTPAPVQPPSGGGGSGGGTLDRVE